MISNTVQEAMKIYRCLKKSSQRAIMLLVGYMPTCSPLIAESVLIGYADSILQSHVSDGMATNGVTSTLTCSMMSADPIGASMLKPNGLENSPPKVL